MRRRLIRVYVYPRISSRRYTGARGSLTACVYRRLYLAWAITSPSATDRTSKRSKRASEPANGVNEPSRELRRGAFSISSQPVTLRPRSHGVYIPSHATRYPVRPRRSSDPGSSLGPTVAARRSRCIAVHHRGASRRRDRLQQRLLSGFSGIGIFCVLSCTPRKSRCEVAINKY